MLVAHRVQNAFFLHVVLLGHDVQRLGIPRVFIGIMRDNCLGRSVQQLADMVYVSKSYLSRAFKQKTGLSLMEYLNSLRMEAAKALLAASNMNTDEIAYRTGYHSAKFFYRAFRAYTGMSTREYRKNGSENRI